jgi:hypothetical protein
MSAVVASIFSILSVVVGVVLGHYLSQQRQGQASLLAIRIKAYSDFITCVSRLAAARRTGEVTNEVAELAALNDAKARICVCAEAPIVEALAEFWKAGGTLEQELEILAFTRFCSRVRESFGNTRNDLIGQNLSDILFKLEPATYSYRADKIKG